MFQTHTAIRALNDTSFASFLFLFTDSQSGGVEYENCKPEYDEGMAVFTSPDQEPMEETVPDRDDDEQS